MSAANQPITLYGYVTSPYVNKVAAFLKFKGLEYDHIHVRPKTNEAIKFTGQKQVPVLKIGDEWRTDSSPLGHWLDERFPETPRLAPQQEDERKTALKIDDWISDVMIPSRFREAVDWESIPRSIQNGWRLASIVHAGTPLPLIWRLLWPFAVKSAPFIVRMVADLDRTEPSGDMRMRILDDLEAHLGEGPYLGGLTAPTIADLSAYVTLMTGWLIGLKAPYEWRERAHLMAWMKRVQSHLPDNPIAVNERHHQRRLPF